VGAIQGCGSGDNSVFDDWTPDLGGDDTGTQPMGTRVTMALSTGLMTVEAVDEEGAPLELLDGFAFDLDGDGVEEIVGVGQDARYRFDSSTLRFLDPVPWQDATGQSVSPVGHWWSSAMEPYPFAAVAQGDEVRAIDFIAGTVSEPVPILELIDSDTGETQPFAPTAISILPSMNTIGGLLIATGENGEFYLGDLSLVFQMVPREVTYCDGGGAVWPDVLVAAPLGLTAYFHESLLVMCDGIVYELDMDRCFLQMGSWNDSDGHDGLPVAGFGADLNGDGMDSLVWIHP